MFSAVRRRLTWANVAMTLALVFAMSGGAYAAGKYLITSTKQISPKVLKALQGKVGPAGAQGLAGSAGPQGPAGLAGKGEKGERGETGSEGKAGANGASVTGKEFTGEKGSCKEGGSEFTAAENKKTYACNGSPWTVGGTLPSGKTETGTWGVSGVAPFSAGGEFMFASISFSIPLETAPTPNIIGEGEGEGEGKVSPLITGGQCQGNHGSPGATAGNLCIFVTRQHGVASLLMWEGNSGKTGGLVQVAFANKEAFTFVNGTWAVTVK